MKKLYEKNELTFAIVWIAVYCVLQSLANPLNKVIGIGYAASAAFCILQVIVLFGFIRKNSLLHLGILIVITVAYTLILTSMLPKRRNGTICSPVIPADTFTAG